MGGIFNDVKKNFGWHRGRQDPDHWYLNQSSVSSLLLPALSNQILEHAGESAVEASQGGERVRELSLLSCKGRRIRKGFIAAFNHRHFSEIHSDKRQHKL